MNNECPVVEVIDGIELETRVRKWSEPDSWSTKTVPVAGDDVVIEPQWNMVYDMRVDDSYILNSLTIDGRLSFTTDDDVHLLSKKIWVKRG